MATGQLTREAVEAAVAEFDRLGRKEFLKHYGFRGARDYFLVVGGKNYDSKAIAAVAHRYLPGGKALTPIELSGGISDAAGKLASLGFEIATPGQNVDWSWDEHVLALDLYMRFPKSPPGKTSDPILELSALLNRLGLKTGVARTAKFRNANGVYMKLMNFRRLDPSVLASGKKGLQRGAEGERRVWERYATDLPGLAREAAAIRLAIDDESVPLAGAYDDDAEADESAVVLRLHKLRERRPELARKKKEQVLRSTGRLACEVCDFDFSSYYGAHGRGFMECHHRRPISTLTIGEKTRLSDLALVCANCHRMLHRRGLLTVDGLRDQIARGANTLG